MNKPTSDLQKAIESAEWYHSHGQLIATNVALELFYQHGVQMNEPHLATQIAIHWFIRGFTCGVLLFTIIAITMAKLYRKHKK